MKKVTLLSLEIANFKGIASLKLSFGGRDCSIYGANGSGKSTIEDAWSWLLFGKNKRGAADFSIKPLDRDGNVLDHGAYTSVTATIDINGTQTELRRTYYEKWTQKRGSEGTEFSGNASDFYIDGVPQKKNEYDAAVKQLIAPEDVFTLITRLTAFSESLNWQKRRQVLFDLFATRSDADLMAMDERFKPLADSLGKLDIDSFKKKLDSDRKKFSEEKNTLPKRIDEMIKFAAGYRDVDYESLRSQLASVGDKKQALSAELVKLDNNTATAEKRNELASVRNELAALENRNREYRAGQIKPVDTSADELYTVKCRETERNYKDLLTKQSEVEVTVTELMEKQENARDEYKKVYTSTIPADEIACPTCGRAYDAAALAAAKAKFEADKKAKLEAIIATGKDFKLRVAAMKAKLAALGKELEYALSDFNSAKAAKPTHEPAPVITDMDGYTAEKSRLKSLEMSALEGLDRINSDSDSLRGGLLRQISDLKQSEADINGKLGGEGALKDAEKRIKELNDSARCIASELEKADKLLFLCGEFTKFKVSFIEDSINGMFRLARFKLFDTQVNGAVVDCCTATYLGVPYDDVNSAAKVNLGLDIIGVVSEHYGVSVPLFCDNSESVTDFITANTQTIRLYVSKNDTELRIEVNELDSKEKGVNTNSAA